MNGFKDFDTVFRRKADAQAIIKGSTDYPDLRGKVLFYQLCNGVVVRAQICGLPKGDGMCVRPIFAFHIHEGTECSQNGADAFSMTHGHYNPNDCPHPYHAGDMPPLFSVNSKAFSAFLTDRFTVNEIIGRTVIIHSSPDDFTTQPSGNAGEKIACGVICRNLCK